MSDTPSIEYLRRFVKLPEDSATHIENLERAYKELQRENAALRAELEGVRKDAERLNGLLKLPVVQAQAILWNYASAKNRKSAIDAAIFEAGSPKVRNEWAKANEAAERLAPRDLLRLLAGWCR